MDIHKLLLRIERCGDRLDTLSNHFSQARRDLKDIFAPHVQAIEYVESQLHDLTHETGTEIGFACESLAEVIRYFSFKRAFSAVEEEIIQEILVPPSVAMHTKKKLLGCGYTMREVLDLIDEMRKKWYESFNHNYARVSEEILTIISASDSSR